MYIKCNDKNLILVRGVSGSGKTEFANEFIHPSALTISTDDFFMINGEYQFDINKLGENHLKCLKSVKNEMEFPEDSICRTIVVHNTFTQAWEIEPYQKLADKYGYNFYTIIVENRHKSKSVHNVPSSVLLNQKNRFEVVL